MPKRFIGHLWRAIGTSLLAGTVVVADSMRQPMSFFVMQAVHNENVSDSVLASPKLQGIHIRDDWQRVEPASNVMSFSWIDGQIARAKSLGKQVTLGVYTGNNSPSWLGVPLVDGVPIPWDPTVIAAHNELVAELGNRYRNETAIAAVHISAPATDASLEMHYPTGLTGIAGYSDALVIDSWKSAIDAYAAAFPNNALVLNVAMAPDINGAVTFPVIDYARQVLGPRANFIHNSLKASTNPTAAHHSTIVDLGMDGERIGFEMVSPSIDEVRFGGPLVDALALGEQAGAGWYQIYQADVPLIPAVPDVVGDYNFNSVVDAADYTVWRDTLGHAVVRGTGADANGDGFIDGSDFSLWKSSLGATFGSGTGGGSALAAASHGAVPEPASWLLAIVALLSWAKFTARQRQS